jgi:hypothetical protein
LHKEHYSCGRAAARQFALGFYLNVNERYNRDLNHIKVLKEEWEIELYKLEAIIAKSEKERADIVKLNLPHRVKSGSKTRHKSYKKVAPNPKMVDK